MPEWKQSATSILGHPWHGRMPHRAAPSPDGPRGFYVQVPTGWDASPEADRGWGGTACSHLQKRIKSTKDDFHLLWIFDGFLDAIPLVIVRVLLRHADGPRVSRLCPKSQRLSTGVSKELLSDSSCLRPRAQEDLAGISQSVGSDSADPRSPPCPDDKRQGEWGTIRLRRRPTMWMPHVKSRWHQCFSA